MLALGGVEFGGIALDVVVVVVVGARVNITRASADEPTQEVHRHRVYARGASHSVGRCQPPEDASTTRAPASARSSRHGGAIS